MALGTPTYIQDELGAKFIAASQRPDGTWRKQRRVREGYVPQEEVPLYESKGKQFVKSQPKYPVGYNPITTGSEERSKINQPIPGLIIDTETKSNKKKKKKNASQPPPASLDPEEIISNIREDNVKNSISNEFSEVKSKKKRSKAGATSELSQISTALNKIEITTLKEASPSSMTTKTLNNKKSSSLENSLPDPTKRLKNLQKKLREIQATEDKIRSGNLKNPDKDQLEKIKRKSEIISEIKSLTLILQE